MTLTASVIFVDAHGNQTVARINTTGGSGSILSAVLACANSDASQFWESVLATFTPAPAAADYININQVALLNFVTASGSIATLRIPAAKLSIFLADGVTVDGTNTAVVNLVAACIGSLTDEAGSLVTAFVGGRLAGR